MSDAMQVADQNRKNYKKAIAQKEAEIAELREMIVDLDNFIEFGNSLLGKEIKPSGERPISRTESQAPAEGKQNWNSGDVNAGITDMLAKRAG